VSPVNHATRAPDIGWASLGGFSVLWVFLGRYGGRAVGIAPGRGVLTRIWRYPRIMTQGGLLCFMGTFVAGTLLPGKAEANA